MMNIKKPDLSLSLAILKRDPHFKILIEKYGSPTILNYFPNTHSVFQALIQSVVYQQISGKAADAIFTRFVSLYPWKYPTPMVVLVTPEGDLKKCGLSSQKIGCVKDTARKFSDGTIRVRSFPKMTSNEIAEHLLQIKGVGLWTAHMLLIFALKRLDILPTGDLGIRKGFQRVYGLKSLPTHDEMEMLAKGWREHASIASWYLWKIADGADIKGVA